MLSFQILITILTVLGSSVNAAPIVQDIDSRTYTKPITVSNNKNNGFVYGSGNGGNGGKNSANANAGAVSIVYTDKGPVWTETSALNGVAQSANGGDGSATGTYGSGNTFYAREADPEAAPTYSYPGFNNNNNNGVVVGSGNGGNGGHNKANANALAGSFVSNKGWGSVTSSTGAENIVEQSANGGSGSAVGTYGQGNTFHSKREAEAEAEPTYPTFYGNDNNGVVIASGNGGNGGTNKANANAFSGSLVSNKGWGKVSSKPIAVNEVYQSADGGSGSAVGSYGSGNKFGSRTYTPSYPAFSNNDNNGIVLFSGNGGNGGSNVAVPVAIAASGVKAGKVSTGSVSAGTGSGNLVWQSSNGGDGNAVGSYGSGNKFGH